MSKSLKSFLVYIMAFGVFGIINTEMGVIGILPQIAERFGVSISQAGFVVSLFALAVAIAGPFLPLLFSGMNRKAVMLVSVGVFVISNVVSIFAPNFTVLLIARIVPAFLHPVYFSQAFTVAASAVSKDQAPKAAAKVFMGLTAGMVLGSPITAYIGNASSLEIAMLFLALVNLASFLAILIFAPSMPVHERLSYGAQLSVLKRGLTWVSIATVILLFSGLYAVYSFFAQYLGDVTQMSGKEISLMLVLFGVTGIAGNVLSGKWLSKNGTKTGIIYPFAAAAVYLLIYLVGHLPIFMIIMIALWGVIYTIGINLSNYSITSAAPEAPEFSNGLFVAFANLGITVGTAVGGLFIEHAGSHQVIWSGLIFMALGLLSTLLRATLYRVRQKGAHLAVEGERTAV